MGAPKVTFLGGVREIGGNKIIVEDGGDRILLDFGRSFSDRTKDYYVNYLSPRGSSYTKDLLEFGLLPRVEGLYDPVDLDGTGLKERTPFVRGLFLSHPHTDHVQYIDLLDPRIPLHVGKVTKTVLDVMATTGKSWKPGEKSWSLFQDGKGVKVGSLEVVPYPVDHSIPGAYGFLVHTSEGCLVYTGDFREHGPRASETRTFLDAAAKEKPVAMLSEGTRLGPDKRKEFTEEQVGTEASQVLRRSRNIALATCYPRDVDRLVSLYEAARASQRDFVVSTRTAYLLKQVAPHAKLRAPIPGKSPGLLVYDRQLQKTGRWEREFLDDALTCDQVAKRGKGVLLQLDLWQFPELIDIRPPKGSPFIHSMSEPFSEEDVEDEVMRRWLDHFGMPLHQLHASGHCSGAELLETVKDVKPKTLFPIHTEHPEAFQGNGINVELPEVGKSYAL